MQYFIGIDPSINSTGICIQKYDGNIKIKEEFIIIKPGDTEKPESKWLVKKEKVAEESLSNFQYCFYPKMDLAPYKELDNNFGEYWKSWNMIMCAKTIYDVINEFTKDNPKFISIVIEGISYGSTQRTKSIFDLAGLNYLIREKFIGKETETIKTIFTIATPAEIKKFASGKGNNNKDIMIDMFLGSHKEFSILPKIDDIADSFFMASYSKNLYDKEILNNND